MLIVGELINTSRRKVEAAVRDRDADFIGELAERQVAAGADYVDVNCGTLVGEEVEALPWLVKTVQARVDVPLCIDSANPEAIEAALRVHRGQAMVNSITAEGDRFESFLPLLQEHGASVIALCMDDQGIPETSEQRFEVALRLVEDLRAAGLKPEQIYIDPLIRPISTGSQFGVTALETIQRVKQHLNGVHTICGLSNISFGLPKRRVLNMTFLALCLSAGLDAAIMDPTETVNMAILRAAEALLGRDEYCRNYLEAYRQGKLSI